MRLPLFLLAAACLALAGCNAAHSSKTMNDTAPTGLLFRKVSVAGVERRYALYVPRDYDGSRDWPTIIFMNGSGECGTDGQKQTLVGLAPAALSDPQEWPFLIIFPQKPDVGSEWPAHDALVFATLKDVAAAYRVDRSRLYLTGLSQGGFGTWNIAAKHAGEFAAIAPVCGWGDVSLANALARTPVWAFHGAKDDVVKYQDSQNLVAAIQKLGGDAKLTLFPDANHNAWDPAYRGDEHLGTWFLKHKLAKRGS